ncbi:GGDEF domain-containing protein [Aerolutibacter ruishenii]|uniref:diguanylate cyclase n=1 Tax=Aerolutibacter ruishenii TaxID=686800 RepID=A0A562LN68_9GAMM|nr:GGDEF domain-containing protein [Lysobacter ruishenii]TWI09057.1 diguanylate cyclase (GGDEF)-like protein [Lysobacter ruishenii]
MPLSTWGMEHDADIVRRFEVFSQVAGLVMIGFGLAVLLGWSHDFSLTGAAIVGRWDMKPGAAIGFMMAGVALLLSRNRGRVPQAAGRMLSLSVLVLGALTLVEYLWTLDLGIDHLFDDVDAHRLGRPPGRIAELAALAFVFLGGVGYLVSVRRGLWLRECLAIGVIAIAMTGMASYGFALAGQGNDLFAHMPIHTSLMLLLGALGWMSSVPTTGLTSVATANSLGGAFARRLLLPALLLPVAFSFVFKALQSRFGVSEVFASVLAALFTGGTVSWTIWWVAALLDRVERQRCESKVLRNDASTDALTGLANRRAFDAALAGLVAKQREHEFAFSLLMLDLDRFKTYNDTFGHPAGDDVMRLTGHLLVSALRPQDVPARYGGEEFAVLLPNTTAEQARDVALRILDDFRAFPWKHRAVTVSIGAAQAREGEDGAALVHRADSALYVAKRAGRNRLMMAQCYPLPVALGA